MKRPSLLHRFTLLSAATLSLGSLATEDVLIVDALGGSAYAVISTAVTAAADGDLILIRPGVYAEAVEVNGIGLSIVARDAGSVAVESLSIRNAPAGSLTDFSGLELPSGFLIEDCAGDVQLQDCTVPPTTWLAPSPPNVNFPLFANCGTSSSRQRVLGSQRVTITDCAFTGADGDRNAFDGYPGHHGLLIESSVVSLYACSLTGGDGGEEGGAHPPSFAGAAGDGLRVRGSRATVRYDRLVAAGGAAGLPLSGSAIPCAGPPVRVTDPGNTAEEDTHTQLTLSAPVLLFGGAPAQIEITSNPGALIVLLSSPNAGWRPLGSATGNLHVGPHLRVSTLGAMPASGPLTHTVSAFDPANDNVFAGIQYQILALGQGPRYLSEPRRLHVIHPSL